MTDIDAIRKRDAEFAALLDPVEHADGEHTVDCQCDGVQAIHDRRALLLAYDAKCEELAQCERVKAAMFEFELSQAKEIERRGEAECALIAERDAAVREREVLRKALNDYGTHGQYCASRRGTAVVGGETEWGPCTCGYAAALAPPTEQPQPIACPVLP